MGGKTNLKQRIRTLPNRLEGESIQWSLKKHKENSGKVHNMK